MASRPTIVSRSGAAVTGMSELRQAFADFMTPRQIGNTLKLALQAAARVSRTAGARNARAMGLAFRGFKTGDDGRRYLVRGRIPGSLKVNRPYYPRGAGLEVMRVNVIARSQRSKGIFRNRAPHAHLVEFGFKHWRSGRQIGGRPFLGPGLASTADQAVEKFRANMSATIDRMRLKGAPP